MKSRSCSSSMAGCEFCAIVKGEYESEEVYQDEKLFAVMHLKPAAPGHVLLFTKEHHSIIEQVPDFVVGHALNVANKLSVAIFEAIGAQGTNIIIENGNAAGQTIPHFSVNIIPRRENDGLNLMWQPKKVTNEEMDMAQYQLKEQAEGISPAGFEQEKRQVVVKEEREEKEEKKDKKEEQDYLFRQMRRIP